MRNLKKILCLALVLSMVLAVVSGAAYTNYADDAELTMVNEDYLLAAQLLKDIGVVVGVNNPEDGKTYYYPDNLLTRAELARVLYVLYSGTTDSAVYDPDLFRDELSTSFTDISGHWAEGYIKYGQAMGYLNGKSATIFDPDANVKAQEMATALLIVIGYRAADLAPNYPINVVKYAYTNDKGNLFTTGLSTAAASGGDHGLHIVGYSATKGATELDNEGELQLERELTREEAFYMMYKAIAQRFMVKAGTSIGNYDVTVGGEYYVPTQSLYVNKFFAADKAFAQVEDVKDIVAGNEQYAFLGANNDAGIYTGKYGKAGYVYLHDTGLVQDFGYTAAAGANGGAAQGYGFILSATDWNKQLGREIKFTKTTWGGKTFITEYAFGVAVGKATEMRSFKGSNVDITKATAVTINGAKDTLTINKVDYTAHAKGIHLIHNNGVGIAVTVEELYDYIVDGANADKIQLRVIDNKIYGVIEEENLYAKVTISEQNAKDGVAVLNLLDSSTITIKNTYELADGDRVFGKFNCKDYYVAAANLAAEKIDVIYDGLTFEFQKVAASDIVNVAVDKVNNKYYMETVNGTEFKLGAASVLKDDYVVGVNGNVFVQNETAYWALYIVDGYCYEAVNTAKVQKIDGLFVTAKTAVIDTTNSKTTYTFTLNTKADGSGTAYSYTKTVDALISSNNDDIVKYNAIAKGDVVRYFYDAKTKAAIVITELIMVKVATVDVALTGYTQTYAKAQNIQEIIRDKADANPTAIVVVTGMPLLKATSAPYAETEAFAVKYDSQAQYDEIAPYLNGSKNMEFTK